jgi:hypothetical protein
VNEAIGYIWRFERRVLDDIRAMGGNTPDEEHCFAGGPLQDDTESQFLEVERMFTSLLPAGVSKFFHNNKKEGVNQSMVNPFTLF